MAANSGALADEDGTHSDWIELHNPELAPIALAGWYLTDTASNKTKWQLPSVTLPAGGYLLVFASNKDRRNPNAPLHTNFALSAGGEYLGLIKADGTTVSSEYAPGYPDQTENISFGLSALPAGGFAQTLLSTPTPGAANSAAAEGKLTETVVFSRAAGPFRNSFSLELFGAGQNQRIRYVVASSNAAGLEPTATSTEYT